MSMVRLLAHSPYEKIYFDPSDQERCIERGGEPVEVNDEDQIAFMRQYGSIVEIDGDISPSLVRAPSLDMLKPPDDGEGNPIEMKIDG